MSSDPQRVQSIFLAAADQAASERAAFLHAQCGADAELRHRVETLLRAHDEPGSILNLFQDQPCATIIETEAERSGTMVGPYKLLEQIGEGGMGVVYMAQQVQPVKRRVAVKVVKPGMDSRQVVARFEAERQALALMDHPHIAKVLDAGATESGRPYFVMELVRGMAITEYCDSERLDTRRRLLLFTDVCRAVQHAHTKAIIHRDLKPSNVLVTLHDGVPVVKVIDFGVAKALNQELTERTMFTQFSQLIGTPLYMSPEQAELSGLDIDTRSDIYSLGVMLYELLTSTTPFAKEQLTKVSYDEMRRIIREVDPPRPSHRVSTLNAEALTTVSHRRGIAERRLSQHLRGELDWIAMKALEKDRNWRYESASALAADINRYLSNQPVDASPPSVSYRARKFIQRNRFHLVTGSLIAAVVVIGLTVAVGSQLKRNSQRRQLTQDAQQSLAAARALIDSGDLSAAEQRTAELRGQWGAADHNVPHINASVNQLITEIEQRQEQLQRLQRFEQLARVAMDDMSYGAHLGGEKSAVQALDFYGVLNDALWIDRLQESYLSEQQQLMVRQTAYKTLLVLADFGIRWGAIAKKGENATTSLHYLERAQTFHDPTRAFYWVRSECQKLLNNKEEAQRDLELFQTTAAATAFDYYLPGHTAGWRGDLEEAKRSYKAALRIQPDHFNSLFFLANRLSADGQKAEAAEVYRACLALRPDHNVTLRNRAILLLERGEHEEALELATKAIASKSASAISYGVRGSIYLAKGQFTEALRDLDKALEIGRRDDFADIETAVKVHDYRAELFWRMGQLDKALLELNTAIDVASRTPEAAAAFDPLIHRAMLLEGKEKYLRALDDLERAQHIADTAKTVSNAAAASAHLTRGRIFHHTQRDSEAIWELDKALGLASIQEQECIREIRSVRAAVLFKLNRPQEAVDDLSKVIAMAPKVPTTFWVWAHNCLSWKLATTDDPAVRDLPRALELARKAVEFKPEDGEYWNTLGVAQYRNGDFAAAITSLDKSLELGPGESTFACNALVLSMAHWQRGDQDEARRWYDQAMEWIKEHKPEDDDLPSFRAEAEELMQIPSGAETTP